ncbi:hypothetical protein [Methylobacterium aquaticum]|uniref:hypothetical protein n=1 Tax=Methylobacterium aquaticum TaxID=270351 RepID=UPI0019314B37|nr:hypothetical protein [Methylobacterium aquaticum]QRE74375.1 hypothetical protein F1D61_12855 [Methylobacterium aquaticum]
MADQTQTLAEGLAAMASAGAPARDPLAVPLTDIPLPPPELAGQLDNSAVGPGEAATRPVEVATLDFVGDEPPVVSFPLKYPFRWQGVRIDEIGVRQLRTGELGDVFARVARENRTVELYDFYAAMTGLPAKVLRALPAIDGEPIIDKAWDFLPPSVRPASG